MFDIGIQEILIILAIALIFIGPKRLPEVASTLGKGFGELKKVMDEFKSSAATDIRTELEKADLLRQHPDLAEKEGEVAAAQAAAESAPPPPFPEEDEGTRQGAEGRGAPATEAPTDEGGPAPGAKAPEDEIPIHEPEKGDA